jgi:hypothetical protein
MRETYEKVRKSGREDRAATRARASTSGAGSDLVSIVAEYTRDAVEVLRDALDSPDFRMRFQAARELAFVYGRMPSVGPVAIEPARALTPAERDAKLAAALESPEVRDWLSRQGWAPPLLSPGEDDPQPVKRTG